MISRIKILILVTHLGGGGAERVFAHLSRHLSPEKFDVHLVIVSHDRAGSELSPAWIQVHRLNRNRVRNAWWEILRLVWKERPRLVLAGMAHLNYLVLILKLLMPSKTRVLVRQNTTASLVPASALSRWGYRKLYPLAFRIVCQSQDMANDLSKGFLVSAKKLRVLHNPVDAAEIRRRLYAAQDPNLNDIRCNNTTFPHLVCVGRLSLEKGFDLLLPAIAQIRHRFPSILLTIAGVGPEESSLRSLRYKLNLDSHVEFAGYQSDLTELYRRATIFVVSSRYEGMPNALLEAAAAGLPLVTTPCCQGVVDLLSSPELGSPCRQADTLPGTWLTTSISAEGLAETLLSALRYLQGSEEKRFVHRFLEPFEIHTAIVAYENMLVEAAA